MTRLTGTWHLAENAQAVCAMLQDAGHLVYFVGGCIRNDLLGVPISDLDLSTDARPEDVMKIATGAGFRVVPTGIEHGTMTVVSGGEGFEITTFRKDVETDGRRAVVAFSDRIEDDARRRDFTMNALYASPDGEILDPMGGLPDLKARHVRFIDDAEARIREDYLRILRFFRFHAWYGDQNGGIDADGLAACAANLSGLETISKERVGAEMIKLMAAPNPAPTLSSMAMSGVLGTVLPGAEPSQLAHLVDIEPENDANPLRRLALIGGDDVADRLRLSRQQQKELAELRDGMAFINSIQELAFRLGPERANDIALLRAVQIGGPLDPSLSEMIAHAANAVFPVKPADLMPELAGRALGDRLKMLETRWIESGFKLTREELLK